MKKNICTIFALFLLVAIPTLSGCNNSEEEASSQEIYEVKRGDIALSVSADGSLVMPREVELRFGTIGTVKEVLVEEGDIVTAGTVLAILDDTAEILSIRSAENSLQQTLSNLVESVSGIQQILGYPHVYPNRSAFQVMEQVQREMALARSLLKDAMYDEAASEMRLAYYDMNSAIKVLEAPITDMENYPEIVRNIKIAEQYPELDPYIPTSFGPKIERTVAKVEEEQEKVSDILSLLETGNYSEASTALDSTLKSLPWAIRAVETTVGVIEKRTMSFPDIAICIFFFDSARINLENAQSIIESSEYDKLAFMESLRMVYHDIEMGYSILSDNELVLEHGLNLQDVQSNRLNLEKGSLSLRNAREDYLKTVILAPFDGMIVDIGVSEDDQLSQQDYSSRTAVHLVDTYTVKFEGTVDEVDIFQVKVGQKADIIVDALQDNTLTGTVTFISPAGSGETGVVSYTVTIELDPTDIQLRGTLTATADVILDRVENVIMVPTGTIENTPDGDFVTVITNETTMLTEKRKIDIGIQSYQFSEVQSGLIEGEKLLVGD